MPVYDFKCDTCNIPKEYRVKFADYDAMKNTTMCSEDGCTGKMVRQMDFSGHFALMGSGWFGREGEGTGYEITQNEMDRNLEQSARDEDTMNKFMHESQKYEEGE